MDNLSTKNFNRAFAKETVSEKTNVLFNFIINSQDLMRGYEVSEKIAVPVVA